MARKYVILLACMVCGAALSGCGKKVEHTVTSDGYFHTPFQTESEFVVGAVVSDLAEQMYFAANHRLPDTNYFSVVATENGGSRDEPVIGLKIRIDKKKGDVAVDLKINGPIWSPRIYQPVAKELAKTIGLTAGNSEGAGDTGLISKLLDAKPETIEQQNQEVSEALEGDFANPELHEKAALLLGAFVLREHSGNFFEIRSPLSRITAHLAMSQFLRGSDSFGVNGQLAEAMMLTMANNQTAALEELKDAKTDDAAIGPMVRGLRTRITGDYRPLDEATNRTPFEDVQWFWAMCESLSSQNAWAKLTDEQRQGIDFTRIAYASKFSVEIGNYLLQSGAQLEMREIKSIYEVAHPGTELPREIASVLNFLPEHCFSTETDGQSHVHVIGWGQWAMFFQRHLSSAIQQNFHQLDGMLGLADEAKKYAAECDQLLGGLTLYPFVRRFDCMDEQSYHQAEDDGFKLTVETPQFVSAQCWNYLCYNVSFAQSYIPSPNPHVNEWHNHNPLPGTVYDLDPRLYHPSLTGTGDQIQRFEALRELAPYDRRLSDYLAKNKYNGKPTYDQAMALYHDTLSYSPAALGAVANAAYNDPQRYVELMTRAAELDPRWYYALGGYMSGTNSFSDEDKAAVYYQKAYEGDQDRVRASNQATWLVGYYLRHGQRDKAETVAKDAGEVYSFGGLEAQAWYYEGTSNYDSALEWYSKIEERYDNSYPLVYFFLRYKDRTGDHRFDGQLAKRAGKLFPKGLEKVSLNDLGGAPADGILIQGDSQLLADAGLKGGDIIVAAAGIRVHNVDQYNYARDINRSELDLLVWQDGAYKESKSNPPNHRFGVSIVSYPQQQ